MHRLILQNKHWRYPVLQETHKNEKAASCVDTAPAIMIDYCG
jgi:hypothetical protein